MRQNICAQLLFPDLWSTGAGGTGLRGCASPYPILVQMFWKGWGRYSYISLIQRFCIWFLMLKQVRGKCCRAQGSPTPGPQTVTGPRPVRNRAAQQEVSGRWASEASPAAPHRSHYPLNHPRHPPSTEKLSSTKPVPGAKKVGDRCCREHRITGGSRKKNCIQSKADIFRWQSMWGIFNTEL